MTNNLRDRLLKVIPGGAHTYSRGFDQFPHNAPEILKSGKGVYVYDDKGHELLDYGMALRAVAIGYAEDAIDLAAIQQIKQGNNLTRPSFVELEAAELMVDLIDSADMVKFAKNGSSAVTAAVKLARAYTGRDIIARCVNHPFFSYDDWFIGSTVMTRGIPEEYISKTHMFSYNDIASLEKLINEFPNQIACVVLEPATVCEPEDNFLQKVQALCNKHNIVFILDEMITGFRWHLKGAQHTYQIKPDLCTFGKAMANGYSVACLAGKREIMELGSIEVPGRERVFLLSSTHGAEMSSLGAFVETISYFKKHNVIDHLWEYGSSLIKLLNDMAKEHNIHHSFKAAGVPCSPYYLTLDANGDNALWLKTLFMQEMIKNGVLMPWIALSYRHGERELALTQQALDKAFKIYKKALEQDDKTYLHGNAVKPVFRKFN